MRWRLPQFLSDLPAPAKLAGGVVLGAVALRAAFGDEPSPVTGIVTGVGAALLLGSAAGDAAFPNPTPLEWKKLPRNTDYACRAGDRAKLGTRVPGRDGGTIVGCATPKGPKGRSRHRVGRWRLETPTVGPLIDKDTAAHRLRDAGKAFVPADRAGAVQWAKAWSRAHEDERLPAPLPALDFPHRAGAARTDAARPLWRDWVRLDGARRRGRLSEGDFWEEVRAHPLYEQWSAANDDAARGILAREKTRTTRSDVGGVQSRAQERSRALARGEDVTAAEYRDRLRRMR